MRISKLLRDDIEQYSKLTGEDGWHVPIIKVGAYLDGYNKGLSALDQIRAEIMDTGAYEHETKGLTEFLKGINYCLNIIDKYNAEASAESEEI